MVWMSNAFLECFRRWLSAVTCVKQSGKSINYEVRNGRHSLVRLLWVSTCRPSLIISIVISVQVELTDICGRTLMQMMTAVKTSPAVLQLSGQSHQKLPSSWKMIWTLHKSKEQTNFIFDIITTIKCFVFCVCVCIYR